MSQSVWLCWTRLSRLTESESWSQVSEIEVPFCCGWRVWSIYVKKWVEYFASTDMFNFSMHILYDWFLSLNWCFGYLVFIVADDQSSSMIYKIPILKKKTNVDLSLWFFYVSVIGHGIYWFQIVHIFAWWIYVTSKLVSVWSACFMN